MLRRASTLPCLRQGRAASPRSASSLQRHRRLRPRRQFCRRIFGSAKIEAIRASSQRCRSMTIVCARTPRDVGTEPELRTAGAAVQTRIVSVAGIRLDPNRSMRCFKGIVYVDISKFESFSIGAGWCQALSDCSVDLMWDVTRRSSLLFGIGTWALP